MKPTIDDPKNYIGDASNCSALFLFGGKWYVPNLEFRRLLGAFGEPLVRNIIGNSVKPINPATLSAEIAAVIHRVCEVAKKTKKCDASIASSSLCSEPA